MATPNWLGRKQKKREPKTTRKKAGVFESGVYAPPSATATPPLANRNSCFNTEKSNVNSVSAS